MPQITFLVERRHTLPKRAQVKERMPAELWLPVGRFKADDNDHAKRKAAALFPGRRDIIANLRVAGVAVREGELQEPKDSSK